MRRRNTTSSSCTRRTGTASTAIQRLPWLLFPLLLNLLTTKKTTTNGLYEKPTLNRIRQYDYYLGGGDNNSNSNSNRNASDNYLSYRQNVCDRYNMFDTKQIELRDVLSGMELHPILQIGEYVKLDPKTGGINDAVEDGNDDDENGGEHRHPGFIVTILDELATRGNFTWRDSFGITYGPNTIIPTDAEDAGDDPSMNNDVQYVNATWTDLVKWSVEMYDISADWWVDTLERLQLGIGFPQGFVSSHFIMIGRKTKPNQNDGKTTTTTTSLRDNGGGNDNNSNSGSSRESSSNGSIMNLNHFVWSWTKPFDYKVWILMILTLVVSSILYVIFESNEIVFLDQSSSIEELGDDNHHHGLGIYGFILVFFQHLIIAPKTLSGKIMILSLGLWSLIMVSTYTANLASFFVIQNTPQVQIATLQDAIDNGLSLCIYDGMALSEWVTKYYPKGRYIKIKPSMSSSSSSTKDDEEVEEQVDLFPHFTALIHGRCDLTLASTNEWEQVQIMPQYNNFDDGGCTTNQLQWIGRIFNYQNAGFAVKVDNGRKCTSLIQDVLHIHLMDMMLDGTMDKLKQEAFEIASLSSPSSSCKRGKQNRFSTTPGDRRRGDNNKDARVDDWDGGSNDSPSSFGTLSMKELSGPFLNHAIALVLAFFVSGITKTISTRRKVIAAKILPSSSPVASPMRGLQQQQQQQRQRQRRRTTMVTTIDSSSTLRSSDSNYGSVRRNTISASSAHCNNGSGGSTVMINQGQENYHTITDTYIMTTPSIHALIRKQIKDHDTMVQNETELLRKFEEISKKQDELLSLLQQRKQEQHQNDDELSFWPYYTNVVDDDNDTVIINEEDEEDVREKGRNSMDGNDGIATNSTFLSSSPSPQSNSRWRRPSSGATYHGQGATATASSRHSFPAISSSRPRLSTTTPIMEDTNNNIISNRNNGDGKVEPPKRYLSWRKP